MQALSAASRYSCGLAKALPPPSSKGSSMSIAKRRDTSTPPIANPSTCARERVPPCQALATRQCVVPRAGSESTLSISSCTASVSMPLTTLEGVEELACTVAIVGIVSFLSCSEDGLVQAANAVHRAEAAQPVVNAPQLGIGGQAGECAGEMGMPGAGQDVLKAVCLEHGLLDHAGLGRGQLTAACPNKICGIGRGLRLHDSIHRPHQLDQLVHRQIPRRWADARVEAPPLELIHDRVLAFLFPVEEEDVLVELGEIGVLTDAFTVMGLREQLDVQGQCQHGPAALAQHHRGDLVRVPSEAVTGRHHLGGQRFDAAEQRLVLQLLVTEPNQRLERDLISQPMIAAELQDLGADETLDQPEHVGVGPALHLAEIDPFFRREEVKPRRQGKPIGQKLFGAIQPTSANDIGLDVPANAFRVGNAAGEPLARNGIGTVHDPKLLFGDGAGWPYRMDNPRLPFAPALEPASKVAVEAW